jgi:nucleoid-associated protein YgaU
MTQNRKVALGLSSGVAIAAVIAWFLSQNLPEKPVVEATPAAPVPDVTSNTTDAATQGTDMAQAEAPKPQAEAEAEVAEAAEQPVTDPDAPEVDATLSFDVVRVEPNGSTLIAGKAPANTDVSILVDGKTLGTAKAGSDGKFASFLDLPPEGHARVLTLARLDADEVIKAQGTQRVILAPQRAVQPKTPVAEAPITDAALPTEEEVSSLPSMQAAAPAQPDTAASSDTPDVAPASAEVASLSPDTTPAVPIASDLPGAPTVLLADDKGLRVLQPGGHAPEVMDEVALDAISYDDAGEVQLTGRAPAEGFVRVYVDNRPIATVPVGSDGGWQSPLPAVLAGDYPLRLDQIGADGSVTSRLETPFRKETTAALEGAPRDASGAITATVVPGSTLWGIALGKYGHGIEYVRVFEANRDKIRNPDLIYPGQVFDLPEQ